MLLFMFCTGTGVIDVYVEQVTGGVIIVKCMFQHTLSVKCYIQLVSDVLGGYYEGVCLEGEGEASHIFNDLVSGTYTVLVYGLDTQHPYCLPSGYHDYITVINIDQTQIPSMTPPTVIQPTSNNLLSLLLYQQLYFYIVCSSYYIDSGSSSSSDSICAEGIYICVYIAR